MAAVLLIWGGARAPAEFSREFSLAFSARKASADALIVERSARSRWRCTSWPCDSGHSTLLDATVRRASTLELVAI